MNDTEMQGESIAIIGMAGRFPKAGNLEEFWRNLRDGVESITFFKDDETQWSWVSGPPPKDNPGFVRARSVLEKPEWFDAEFFNMTPREAEIMDPQQRIFLECAWEALEDAGYAPDAIDGLAGVFAGSNVNTYLLSNLLSHRPPAFGPGEIFKLMIGNDKDYLTTRVSYKLNLHGPSVTVQTACSTSLMAVCLACQSLLSYQSDLALAGGVSVGFPQNKGHLFQEGGILSPDGHCRSFDSDAAGTIFGDGAGIVVLKRLSDAQADGDRICAVIRGSALNNDGARKIGFTAPSVDGQAEVIALAHAVAGVEPSSISYLEAHGTGTPMGDPIEIAGLTKAFGPRAGAAPTCAIGSVKSNIGHSDVAAGVAGLIKTVLALQHRQLPPTLHFQKPNPKIDFELSPFYPNTTLKDWPRGDGPRRAGVSAFGIGGTNAHVVLEEAPPIAPSSPAQPWQLLTLSARSSEALEAATTALALHLEKTPDANFADIAHTLQAGRKAFSHRRAIVCRDLNDAIEALSSGDPERLPSAQATDEWPAVAFLFPGQGSQYPDMGRELYATEPVFRDQVDHACELLKPHLGLDLRSLLFPEAGRKAEAAEQLAQTAITQPALFVIEHALARLWMHWGIRPQAMIGHSLGEYVAACVAGVFTLEDALRVVAERARLMQRQQPGVMIAVRTDEVTMRELLGPELSLAAVNGPKLCVAAGSLAAISVLEKELERRGLAGRRLMTSHAFHSSLMEPMLPLFADVLKTVTLRPPQMPWVSNVTSRWITAEQAVDPGYWVNHVRSTVRFADSLGELAGKGITVLLEAGPGQVLGTLARQHPVISGITGKIITGSLAPATGRESDRVVILKSLGQLWMAGATVDWTALKGQDRRLRVALPTYPFERKRHAVEPASPFEMSPVAQPNGHVRAIERNELMNTNAVSVVAKAPGFKDEGETLTELRTLFQDLSGVDLAQADPGATFYELGFDSLFLTQASLAVQNRFKTRMSLRQLLNEFTTLGKLAAHLEGGVSVRKPADAAADGDGKAVIPQPAPADEPIAERVPLTEGQHEVWFASQMSAEASAAYNETTTLRLTGALDIEALRRAVKQLGDRHQALRTTFSPAGDFQRIAAAVDIELPLIDFTHLAEKEREERVIAFVQSEAGTAFDLNAGPLLRVHLIRTGAQDHLLVLVVHHLISDGWSQGVLICDLGELYSANRRGEKCVLPVAGKFGEYARRDASRGETAEFSAAEIFWTNQFTGPVPVLELPVDYPRPAERTYQAGTRSRALSPDIRKAVKRLCEARGCTTFALLLSAFELLLHRLSGQDDIVVGVPAAAQVLDGVEDLVGHCANLLPVRSRISENQSFGGFLDASREGLLGALEHWAYPFGSLIRKLNLPRDANRVPLVNVVFNYNRLRSSLRFDGLASRVSVSPKRYVYFDLIFDLMAAGDELFLNCHFSAELFNAGSVDRLIDQYENILRGIVADSAQTVSRVPLLSESESRRILVEWNDTAMDYPQDRCIHELFAAQAARTPSAVALIAGEERLTYRDLDRWSDVIARRLRALGVGPDTRVGIFLERTPALIASMLGVLKAGGAYVPMDPGYPKDRVALIVEDSRMQVLLTGEKLRAQISGTDAKVLFVDARPSDRDWISEGGVPSGVKNSSRNLAYVLYTSGSTGRPKGVEIEHRSVIALIAWAQATYQPEDYAGVLAATSVCFDLSVFEVFFPLASGGKVILAENILHLPDLPALSEVTLINTVPSAISELLQAGRIPATVKTINLAGEALSQDLVEAVYRETAVKRVFDLYGPTETTVYSTYSLRTLGGRATIGRPLANEQAYILDHWRQPVPVGMPGELYLGGDGLARGYLLQPQLTQERFVENPFRPGTRLYRTGDSVRYREDGNIEYLGRLDQQVKLRGHRIELGEIEAALRRHPSVREAVALVRTDQANDQRLVAYIIPADQAPDTQLLRAHLTKALPKYMVPAAFVTLSKLPLTPNGKVDRKALPAPESRPIQDDETAFAAPRSTTEEVLVDIWRGVLGVEQIGTDDNFFELGGHSLMATQVLSRVRDAFQVDLSLRRFFATPLISDQAAAVEEAMMEEIQNMPDADAIRQAAAGPVAMNGRFL